MSQLLLAKDQLANERQRGYRQPTVASENRLLGESCLWRRRCPCSCLVSRADRADRIRYEEDIDPFGLLVMFSVFLCSRPPPVSKRKVQPKPIDSLSAKCPRCQTNCVNRMVSVCWRSVERCAVEDFTVNTRTECTLVFTVPCVRKTFHDTVL